MFENIIERISGEPILLGVALVIGIIAILFLLKKLVKFAFGLFFIAALVLAFIYFTGDDPKNTLEKAIDKGQETVKEVQEKAKEAAEDIENLKDKVGEKIPGK